MGLFGSGRSDERRRRVLTEEVISGGKASAKTTDLTARTTEDKPARNRYGEAARMERQTRLTDLIPRSYAMLAVYFLLGGLVIAGLEALYFYMPQFAAHTTDGRIATFDLDSEGSLGAWFSTFQLTLAAGAALIIYSVRKHRADDYHARYRIWLVTAFCWFVMSIDEAASLHEGFKELMTSVTGERGYGDGSVWWVGAYGVILGGLGIKLLLEMKECRTSTALMFLTAGCYAASVVAQLNLILPDSGAIGVMLEEGLEMAGNQFLLVAMLAHARYVFLEAKGEIAARQAKPKKEKKSTAKTAAEPVAKSSGFGWFRKAKIDPAHATPAPAGKTSDLEPVSKSDRVSSSVFRPTTETYESGSSRGTVKKVQADFSEDEDDDDRRDNRKLSKSDRKALRRQKDFERRYGEDV